MAIEATGDIATRVVGAIREAARATGTGFNYLLKTAMRESSFNPNAKASTSSATGLFQFIDQTWLATLKQSGPGLGYGSYADAVKRTASGRYVVTDPAMRQKVMNLRYDPAANALMAGAFTRKNTDRLAKALGRGPTDGELYIAHFLGQSGAVKFISATDSAPQGKAADLFPNAARANRSIFYDKQGGARSLAQVYAVLVAKHDGVVAPPAVASASAPSTAPAAPAADDDAIMPPMASAYASDPAPKFNSLFSTERSGPVSSFVHDLWGADAAGIPLVPAATPAAGAEAARPAAGRIGTPLDLFQFLRPDIRAQQTAHSA